MKIGSKEWFDRLEEELNKPKKEYEFTIPVGTQFEKDWDNAMDEYLKQLQNPPVTPK